jgi:sucrose-6-phosphate hydrolase SacC (GH32 family)
MNNWNYAAATPTHPWRGAMTVPRELALASTSDGIALVQSPVRELAGLRRDGARVAGSDITVINRRLADDGVAGDALDIELTIQPDTARHLGLRVHAGQDVATVVGIDLDRRELYVDRTRSGHVSFHNDFPGRHAAPLHATDDELRLRVLLDCCTVEVFADGGRNCLTELVFPPSRSSGIELWADGAVKKVTMDVWQLEHPSN